MKPIDLKVQDVLNVLRAKRKTGQIIEHEFVISTLPCDTKSQVVEAIRQAKEVVLTVQSVVTVQTNKLFNLMLAGLHTHVELNRCNKGHRTCYFFSECCPICTDKLHDLEGEPLIVGKIAESIPTPLLEEQFRILQEVAYFHKGAPIADKCEKQCVEIEQHLKRYIPSNAMLSTGEPQDGEAHAYPRPT